MVNGSTLSHSVNGVKCNHIRRLGDDLKPELSIRTFIWHSIMNDGRTLMRIIKGHNRYIIKNIERTLLVQVGLIYRKRLHVGGNGRCCSCI